MLYAVPTLLVESIEAQHNDMMKKERRKRRRDDNNPNFESLSASASITVRDTCRALISLSEACALSLQYRISEDDILKIER
jgi:hypothetical protein